MYPTLFHLGRIAISTEGVLVASGLLGGLLLACRLASRSGVDPDRIWNLGLLSLLTLFVAERMLIILFNLSDFTAHPLWMLGLISVRDERYFYGGALVAICAGLGYILAWRLPWMHVLDALAPGASLALAFIQLGEFAAGTGVGRDTSAAWGLVYTSRIAARVSGTPLGVPLVPLTLYAALLYLGLAACAVWLLSRATRPGIAAEFWLFSSGLGTVLLAQLRYPAAEQTLLLNLYTPAQTLGIVAVGVACALHLGRGAATSGVEQVPQ